MLSCTTAFLTPDASNVPSWPTLASFDQLWSPRIVTQVNDYDVRVAKVAGEYVWHAHDDTDEFFLVLHGVLDIGLREQTLQRANDSITA